MIPWGQIFNVVSLVIFVPGMLWHILKLQKRNNNQSVSIERLLSQVKALQAHPESWQQGYTAGRKIGTSTALAEREQLNRLYTEAKQDRARLDSGMIIITGRDEFGETTRTHARGLNLRQLIDEAIEEHTL